MDQDRVEVGASFLVSSGGDKDGMVAHYQPSMMKVSFPLLAFSDIKDFGASFYSPQFQLLLSPYIYLRLYCPVL
jgi:hypothetical protein